MGDPIFHISSPRRQKIDGADCITAQVAGEPLWFKCEGIEMEIQPEAFLTTFFIPALHNAAQLSIDAKVHSGWIENTKKLLPIYHRWWNYPLKYPIIDAAIQKNNFHASGCQNTRRSALCFSGGVDSFYSLLRTSPGVKYLLFINGFDIPLNDVQRFNNFKHALHQISEVIDVSPIIVHTNMREHASFRRVPWERTHGAALAAVGLLLTQKIDSLTIPSSYIYSHNVPWGSHWETDHLWSLPRRLEMIHDDISCGRCDKIVEIADEPLVKQYLRVCWRNRTPTGNCSSCEKCLRTMVTLQSCGQLAAYYRVFDTKKPLSRLLDNLDSIPQHLIFVWQDLASRDVPSATRHAIKRLLQRSKPAVSDKARKRYQSAKNLLRKSQLFVNRLFPHTTDKP